MIDTNNELLHQVTCIAREYRDGILDDTLMVREMTAALSARASAGEGGVDQLIARVDKVADDILDPNDDSSSWELATELYDVCADLRTVLTAAPQPAQSGASGGGEPSGQVLEVCRVVDDSYFARVEFIEPVKTGDLVYTTPASPATGECRCQPYDEMGIHDFRCPLVAAPQPQPPINSAETYSNPIGAPAHGDGEGDWYTDEDTGSHHVDWDSNSSRQLSVILKKNGKVGWAMYVDGERLNGPDAMAPEFMDALRKLTTRPTPEAHTGTVADIPDADLLCRAVHQLAPRARRQPAWARIADVFALGSTYATQLCRRFGVDPETGKKVDALALPAQGEG